MGNSNSSQTIGFKYFLGVHAVLAQNKLRILGLKFGEKTAWIGSKAGSETIPVDNKELYGGKDAEGGVSGSIDVLDGDAAQAKNSYLQGAIGGTISAYRGVTSLVFRQFYFGNNPYIKRMAIKAIDNEVLAQWYEEKALVNIDVFLSGAEIYIAMDLSGSMSGSKLTFMKDSVNNYLESLKGTVNTVKLVGWSSAVDATTEIANCDDDDYDTLQAWVSALTTYNSTSFAAGVSLTTAFFSTDSSTGFSGEGILENEGTKGSTTPDSISRIILFMTDGEPNNQADVDAAVTTLDGLTGVDVYCFNIDLLDIQYTEQLDNTPDDGVPVIDSSDSGALIDSLQTPFVTWADMNVAHVLRDAMVLANRGDDSIIGDSFTEFADLCYEEGMGVSLFWRDTSTYNEFMDKVKAHADCVTYADRTTGKMEVKAIRNDFDVGTLFVYDTTNVSKWHPDISAPLQHKLPNQLTIVYTKRTDGSQASITDANIAAIQNPTVGRVIAADPIVYEGFTTDEIAGKVLSRDLAARTVPLYSGTIDVAYAPENLNIGHAFIVNNPKLGLNNLVVRLRSKTELGGRNPKTTLTFLEDKFSTPLQAAIVPDTPTVVNKAALDSPIRLFAEVGYYTLVLDQSQTTIDEQLSADPDSGILAIVGSKPNNLHSSLDVATDNGAGWVLISSGGFMPTSTLSTALAEADILSFDVVDNDGLRQVVAGSLCLVDTEIMRVDNMIISGSNVTMTVGRGCLDTVPEKHTAGAAILFYDGFALHDPTQYTAGETIDGKILPKTSEGRLSLDDATTEQVTLDSRAIRPYPVGNLAMDGEIVPTGIMAESVAVTWAHRDRTLQLTTAVEDYEDASIGPETGVEYTLEVRAILEREDFFAPTDFFDGFDLFADDGDGTLIRSEGVGQTTAYTYDESGVSDFFAAADFFEATDFFAKVEPDFFAPADFFAPDWFFGVVGGRALRTQIKVSVERDGYDNWTTANVEGQHLSSPINLVATAVESGGFQTVDLTIVSGKVGSDLTNYPIVVDLSLITDADWWADVAKTDGGDIRVFDGSDVALPFDMIDIDTTAKTGICVVRSDVASAADTTIRFVAYDDVSMALIPAADTNGQHDTWQDFEAVYLLRSDLTDRTSNGRDLTARTGSPTYATTFAYGLGGGVDTTAAPFDATHVDAALAGLSGTMMVGASMQTDTSSNQFAFSTLTTAGTSSGRFGMGEQNATSKWAMFSENGTFLASSVTCGAGDEAMLHAAVESGGARRLSVDGVLEASSTTSTRFAKTIMLGAVEGSADSSWRGDIGMAYLRSDIVSADWIAADFLNFDLTETLFR